MGDDGNISPDTSGSALKKPQEFRVLMYGIAKRNGAWHGSKINTINNYKYANHIIICFYLISKFL